MPLVFNSYHLHEMFICGFKWGHGCSWLGRASGSLCIRWFFHFHSCVPFLSFLLFVFWQREHVCYKYSNLTSVNAGMSLKCDFIWVCVCYSENVHIVCCPWMLLMHSGMPSLTEVVLEATFFFTLFFLIKRLVWINTNMVIACSRQRCFGLGKCNLGPFTMTGVCTFAYMCIIQVAVQVVHTALVVHLAEYLNIYSKRPCSLRVWSFISTYF